MNISLNIPLIILLIPFGIFVLFYFFYSFFNVYHLLRFGIYGYGAFFIILIYGGVSVFLLGTIFYTLGQYDWFVAFPLSKIFGGANQTDLFF